MKRVAKSSVVFGLFHELIGGIRVWLLNHTWGDKVLHLVFLVMGRCPFDASCVLPVRKNDAIWRDNAACDNSCCGSLVKLDAARHRRYSVDHHDEVVFLFTTVAFLEVVRSEINANATVGVVLMKSCVGIVSWWMQ